LEAGESHHFEHLHHVILLLEPEDFIPLVRKDIQDEDADYDDYPILKSWLDSLTKQWQSVWNTPKQPKFLILLHRVPEALDRIWINHNKKKKRNEPSPPRERDLEDAINWLTIHFQLDCVHCPSLESIQANIHKMSRGICEGVYADQVSELQCIKKIKQGPNTDDPLNRARDTWLRMLQQVPRISETKARNIVQHYPTMQSLWQAYQDCDDEAENAGRLANVFDGKSQQMKVSETLYRFMTSENPNELL
jgi:hypothetical protein